MRKDIDSNIEAVQLMNQDELFHFLELEESNPLDNSFKSGIYDYLNWFYDGEQDDFLL
jgi:hypothetical protein